jgi:HEAT repeat protein
MRLVRGDALRIVEGCKVAVKRIVEYHISRLKDKNPEVRLKAIKELELLADPDALDALGEVFANDPHPDIRKAAQDAGRVIFLKRNSS